MEKKVLIVIFIVSSLCLKKIERKKDRKAEKKNRTLCHNSGPLSAYVCTPEKDFKISNESLTQAVRDCFRGSL